MAMMSTMQEALNNLLPKSLLDTENRESLEKAEDVEGVDMAKQ